MDRQIGVEVSSDWEQLTRTGVEYRHYLERIEAAVRMLVPRGWTVMTMQPETVAEAVRLADAGRGDGPTTSWRGSGRGRAPGGSSGSVTASRRWVVRTTS